MPKASAFAGYFESNVSGVRLSKAAVFQPGRVPIIGRFALAGGQPYMADGPKAVRSMALSFRPPNGEEWRTGMNDLPDCSPQSQIPRQASQTQLK
jgi:catalase